MLDPNGRTASVEFVKQAEGVRGQIDEADSDDTVEDSVLRWCRRQYRAAEELHRAGQSRWEAAMDALRSWLPVDIKAADEDVTKALADAEQGISEMEEATEMLDEIEGKLNAGKRRKKAAEIAAKHITPESVSEAFRSRRDEPA